MAGVSTALGEAGSAASAGVVFVALVVDFAVLVLLGRDLLPDPVFEPGLAAVGLALVGVAAGDEVGLAGGAGQLVSGSAWVLGATTTTLIIPIVALLGTDTDGSTRVYGYYRAVEIATTCDGQTSNFRLSFRAF